MIDDTGTEGQVGRYDELAVTKVMDGHAVVNGPEGEILDWDAVDWRQVESDVRRLRQRIFAASRAGDLKKVRNLQKLMLRSRANALSSVRRVTELNAGRLTAGVDGKVVGGSRSKALWVDWVQNRCRSWTAKPVRRVYVPKANGKRRPDRDSRDRRQDFAGPDVERVGARVGSAVRAEVLRLPAWPRLP